MSNRRKPVTSDGIRSGVNWIRAGGAAEGRGQRGDEVGFAEAGFAFQQHMATGQQRGEHLVDDGFLTEDHAADLLAHPLDQLRQTADGRHFWDKRGVGIWIHDGAG